MAKYEIINLLHNKHAIREADTGRMVSNWHDWIYVDSLAQGESDYYIAEDNGKEAIFHKDNKDNPVSGWHDGVSAEGLVQGKSDYYTAEDNGKEAVFHKDDKDNPVSERIYWIAAASMAYEEYD